MGYLVEQDDSRQLLANDLSMESGEPNALVHDRLLQFQRTPPSSHEDIFAGQRSYEAQRMRADLQRVARHPFNILITGETGTGKTEMARQIHRWSPRANKPFVELNCANLPEQLVEAELFGHRKGAFTGADYDRKGLFEEANGGTIFLDEIGDVPLVVQNRLLKAIEEKQIKRLGTNHYKRCDVHIIAATSRNILRMIEDHQFREDLYCRLAVLTVKASPLRDRRDDIPSIVVRFLFEAGIAAVYTNQAPLIHTITKEALHLLEVLDYPGNIRELRNLIFELTTYLEPNQPITLDLTQTVLNRARSARQEIRGIRDLEAAADNGSGLKGLVGAITNEGDILLPLELCVVRRDETFKQWTARAKRCSIEAARQAAGGSLRDAAERLGLSHSSLKNHLQRARRIQSSCLFNLDREGK